MAKYNAREYRAITWYAQDEGLKLTLCQRPMVYYLDEEGEEIEVRLSDVVQSWEAHLRVERRNKARQID